MEIKKEQGGKRIRSEWCSENKRRYFCRKEVNC